MYICFEVKNKETLGDIDEYLDEELTPFQYSLEELSRYVDGEITIELDKQHLIYLDLYSDFSLNLDEIIIFIHRVKSSWVGEDYIWFCEQGRDIYLYYNVNDAEVNLSYTKGKESDKGEKRKLSPDFNVKVSKLEFINEWKKVFQKLSELFEKKLNKKIEIPF
jgi:hypothetical protein